MMLLPDYRIRQRDYLLEIARAMTEVLNLDELLERIVKIAAEMLAGQAGLIALRGEEGGWKVSAAYGIPNGFLRSIDPLLAEVPYNQEPERFEVPKINRLLQYLTRVASLSLLTGVALPLISRGQVIGLIFIFRGYSGLFSANDRALLQSFADQAAIAVQNAQLYTQVSL
ncbi:MAG TPA: GAF domain-containing protein, partial [Anaerolineae bacterium]|nr:GAF domain-containing protein [Anaerolineae bacterium]